MSDYLRCPVCLNGFQPGQGIRCCLHDMRHNVHRMCQPGTTCSLCRCEGMQRNTLLEAMLEDGTVPSEEHEMPFPPEVVQAETIFYNKYPPGLVVDGSTYKGGWKDDQFHGKGIVTRPNGVVEEGTFHKGKRHGVFNCKHPDGRVDKLHYRNGNKDGLCTYRHADGAVVETYHEDSRFWFYKKVSYPNGTIIENGDRKRGREFYKKVSYPNGTIIENGDRKRGREDDVANDRVKAART